MKQATLWHVGLAICLVTFVVALEYVAASVIIGLFFK